MSQHILSVRDDLFLQLVALGLRACGQRTILPIPDIQFSFLFPKVQEQIRHLLSQDLSKKLYRTERVLLYLYALR